MNILFLTQAGSVNLFADLRQAMGMSLRGGRVGFYVADSQSYALFLEGRPDFEATTDVIKEWEIQAAALSTTPDHAKLKTAEARLEHALWNGIVADRRLFLGPEASREQDYACRFSHDDLLSIALATCEKIEALFDRVQPDLVVGFICVTIGEYVAYLVARSRGIRFVNLRPTRIRNYFYGGEDVFEPSARLERAYRREWASGGGRLRRIASEILTQVRATHAMYEGVLPAANQAEEVSSESRIVGENISKRLRRIWRDTWNYNFGHLRADTHRANRLHAHWFRRVKKPWRLWRLRAVFGPEYVRDAASLTSMEYAFFPLHKEPEVTLLVYARPWLNQIEAVRSLARSLPVGMKLVVKEHPAALGYRPLNYYRKLRQIPNVVLAAPELSSREILRHAKLVTIIGGSVGLEALMLRLPVIALGNVPFQFLPPTMIRTISNVHRLDVEIRDLLATHRHDEAALEAYVAAVAGSSVPVDFYSVLLGRRGAYRPPDSGDESSYAAQIQRLAAYILLRQAEDPAVAGNNPSLQMGVSV